MKIAILSIYPFPYGMAATNRIAAYSKGLAENGVEVDVITIHSTEPPLEANGDRLPDKGDFNGVHYIHPTGRYRNKSKLLRGLAMKTGWRFIYGASKVDRLFRRNKYDAAILSFDEPHALLTYSQIAHKHGAKAIFIFDEYPIPIRHKLKTKIPKWKELAYRLILSHVDGYISISRELANFYNNFCKKPQIILPVIVNEKRFQPKLIQKKDWITYIGNMESSKDNVGLIAEAFSLIAEKFKSFSLHFFGPRNSLSIKTINDIAVIHNLENRIFIEGPIHSDEVADIINYSKIMVSSQPNTLRAKGGFPTKLGEYVIMGTPTLLCDVGENSKYLTTDDCFFVEPENPILYAEKLDYILSNYDKALAIAAHGRQTIIDKYSQTAAGEKIKSFIQTLL